MSGWAVPTGAPQKTMGVPFKGSFGFGPITPGGGNPKSGGPRSPTGHGPSAGADSMGASGVADVLFTKLAKSTKQLIPGRTMRMGVKPGQMTKLST